ncbi:MAG TPA: TPM domain-containing protein [Vicinamibacterales bacterium]|nr:TPM domain-containing protein [Vicinamibacterales bacterium]
MIRARLAAAALVLAALAGAAAAEDLPALTAPVNDFANVIDAASAREIDARIRALERASGDVIVVATVDTFAPFGSIEEMAVRMFENHRKGLGRQGQDNGALILVAVQDRKVRIEVGYGLEEHITDAFAGQTIRDVITPRFRRGEMGAGLLEGTSALVNRVAARRGVALEGVPPPASSRRQRRQIPPGMIITLLIIGFMFFSVLSSASAAARRMGHRRNRRGPWSGWHGGVGPFGGGSFGGGFGGGGSGFGGFGGGRSGGGGASGGW